MRRGLTPLVILGLHVNVHVHQGFPRVGSGQLPFLCSMLQIEADNLQTPRLVATKPDNLRLSAIKVRNEPVGICRNQAHGDMVN